VLGLCIWGVATGEFDGEWSSTGSEFMRGAGINMDKHYYEVLGLQVFNMVNGSISFTFLHLYFFQSNATLKEIKDAYKAQALKWFE
jgi:hypothetical protein